MTLGKTFHVRVTFRIQNEETTNNGVLDRKQNHGTVYTSYRDTMTTTLSHPRNSYNGDRGIEKGRSKSMDNSSHSVLELLLDEEIDQSSQHYHRRSDGNPSLRSKSMDGGIHLQLKKRFDAVTAECGNIRHARSPRRPERQASLLSCNVANNNINSRRHQSRSSPEQQQQLPPLVVYINHQFCDANDQTASGQAKKNDPVFPQPNSKARDNSMSPRRPVRQLSCRIQPVDVSAAAIHATCKDMVSARDPSPRRPTRRPSVLQN